MGIIIVALGVEGTDADAPAAIAVPAHGLHHAPFHGYDGGSLTTHQVVAQVFAPEAEGPGHAEIIAVAVAVTRRDGRKGLQAIRPHPLSLLFDGVTADQPAQSGGIGFMVVIIVFIEVPQQFLRRFIFLQIRSRLPDRGKAALSPGAAGRQCQRVNPGDMLFLPRCQNILIQSVLHGFVGNVKIHPADGLPPHGHHQHGNDQKGRKNPPQHPITSKVRMPCGG